MKEKILHLLKNSGQEFLSGEDISKEFGVTRAAIWKYINSLKEDGYRIESVSRKGYRIIEVPDSLTGEEVDEYLHTKYMGRNIVHFETIDSTNTKAKELAAGGQPEGTVIISEEQTQGKGRLGRNWTSPKNKGIWMSIILRPDIDPVKVCMVTQVAAAAAAKAIEEIGIKGYIKWPNDIVVEGKKVCGILTEMSGELDKINYVILGIGINVNLEEKDFPEELKDIATSLKIEKGKSINRKELVGKILNNFENLYESFVKEDDIEKSLDICREKSILLGKEIQIIGRNEVRKAKAITIDEEGRLVVRCQDGKEEKIISGEVSIRGMYGYVD
ncbi:biotin--[acetyl-CoA-carboxylase] ligase [Haloimpatiens lingqiaonensis]|uniref:biotin--[acetyl-CoA-carboxylase] ligase n=1 Tax=Haloimpatiens lingqiaonensis TaxID=1380675 RepID=UPI0010FDA6DB|nr:biotin--[acetyl-CoA-carboxylase] ligase [Haloimpatiens lingqiaonensis]